MKNLIAPVGLVTLLALSLASVGCGSEPVHCSTPGCLATPDLSMPDLSPPTGDMALPPPPDLAPPPDPFANIPSGFVLSDPATYDFGSVPVGSVASTSFTFTVIATYPNYAARWIFLDSSLQPSDELAISVSGCSSFLHLGDRCTATVSFSPLRSGSAQALLVVVASDGASVNETFAVARLGGSATATHTTLAADTASFDFQGRQVGSTNNVTTLSFHNSGSSPTAPLVVALDGDGYTIAGDGCSNTHLAADAHCSVSVLFSPAARKSYAGKLSVSAANVAAAASATLAGKGIDPARLQLTQPTFAAQWLGETSPAVTAHLSNAGSDASDALVVTIAGSDAAAFTVASDGCSGHPLDGGGGCDLGLTFKPTDRRAYAATLTVDGGGGHTVSVTLNGNGKRHSVLVTGSLKFTDSGFGNLLFENRGDDDTSALATTIAPAGGPFSVSTDQCSGKILAPSDNCLVNVRFDPSVAGTYDGAVTVTGAAAGPDVGAVRGTLAATPQLRVSPSRLEFGSAVYPSAGGFVSLWNVGPGELALTTSIADPAFHADSATLFLAAGARATLHVTFTPPATAEYGGTLILTAADGSTAASIPVHGIGLWPAFDFSPSELAFGPIVRGHASAPQTVTVHNRSNRAQGTRSVVIGDDYTFDATTCPDTLPPDAACTITLTFGPRTLGPSSGQLVFPAAEAQPTVALTGTGTSQ